MPYLHRLIDTIAGLAEHSLIPSEVPCREQTSSSIW